jgi:hypothetical protein
MTRLGLLVLAVTFASCSAKSETESLTSVDYGEPRGVEFVFGLQRIDARFRLEPDAVVDFDALFNALQSSSDTGRSMRVIYDARSGRFEPESALPSYDVHSIEYDGDTFEVQRARG